MFKDRLKQAMQDLGLNQVQVCAMIGKSKASVSQYLSGKQVPSEDVQTTIAISLGLTKDYFTQEEIPPIKAVESVARRTGSIKRLTVEQAAKLLGVDKMTVSKGLRQGVFPWGYGIKTTDKSWTYIINAESFARIEGVQI